MTTDTKVLTPEQVIEEIKAELALWIGDDDTMPLRNRLRNILRRGVPDA